MKELIGEDGMRNLAISAMIFFALACSCQSMEAIKISQESGMAILSNFRAEARR